MKLRIPPVEVTFHRPRSYVSLNQSPFPQSEAQNRKGHRRDSRPRHDIMTIMTNDSVIFCTKCLVGSRKCIIFAGGLECYRFVWGKYLVSWLS